MPHNQFNNLKNLTLPQGGKMKFYSLPALEKMGFGKISRLPVCIRIVLESIVRNYDDKKITATHVKQLARWKPNAARTDEIPFIVARIVLQDFTGIPLLADLAAMRSAAKRSGGIQKSLSLWCLLISWLITQFRSIILATKRRLISIWKLNFAVITSDISL